jgi:glycosyltransferase involved in cell wall biosynthesis
MRILHVIWSIDPRTGGPGHAIRKIASYQLRAGHEVSIATTSMQLAERFESREAFKARMLADAELGGIEVFLGKAFGRRKPWSSWAHSHECSHWLRQRMADKSRAPDVVHIHGVFSHVTAVAAAQARRHGIPYIVRPAGMLNAACLKMGRQRLKAMFTRLFLRKDLQEAGCIHVTSQQEASAVAGYLPTSKIRIIPHGVTVSPAPDGDARRAILERFPQLRGKRVVLSIARISPKKRPEMLVEAIARLRPNHQDLMLLLAGSDEGHLAVVKAVARQHAIEDAVVCPGFLDGHWKAGAFAVADLFALPSLDENFAVAVIEAMAHAVPVLVTPEVAAHVYADESGGGLTITGTPEAFAEGIRTVLSGDPQAMGRRGREYVEKNLTWPAVIQQIDAMYRDAIAQRP